MLSLLASFEFLQFLLLHTHCYQLDYSGHGLSHALKPSNSFFVLPLPSLLVVSTSSLQAYLSNATSLRQGLVYV